MGGASIRSFTAPGEDSSITDYRDCFSKSTAISYLLESLFFRPGTVDFREFTQRRFQVTHVDRK